MGGWGRRNDAAKPCVRVNSDVACRSNRKVWLPRCGGEQQDVSGPSEPLRFDKPGSAQCAFRDRETAAARTVIGRQVKRDADVMKAGKDQPDTVQPVGRVAPLQAERRTHKRVRSLSQRMRTVYHACDG